MLLKDILIKDVISRDLSKPIEEITKVYQADEETVYTEITEYVATDRIKEQYGDLLKAISEAPSEPSEGIGVWISGFFGSGKSSFAKNLGYILANQQIVRQSASDLFKAQLNNRKISDYIDYINKRIPIKVVMFDVSVERSVKKGDEKIAEIMYTVLLRELDYAEDFTIADLEIELESENKLAKFKEICESRFGDWRTVRKGAQKFSRASAILHEMDPSTYSTADSWSKTIKNSDISVGKFVERSFELMEKRGERKSLTFVIDEVGQYVAHNPDKIEDLRAVVEAFGKESKNRLKAKKIIAPVWVIVTSQEKLEEIVDAIDSKRINLAKLLERFKHRIDLAPSDIREVASRRVLAKNEDKIPLLKKIYKESQGQLNISCHLDRTTRKTDISEDDFVQFYPYLPHFIELSIDIMSGIRLQPGAPKHYGGSNRTVIKQAYEMLVSDQTHLATCPVGALVSLDRIYELVEGNLSSEKRKDINEIYQQFKDDPNNLEGLIVKVAKAICLLEFVRNLPRTEANIAAVLVDEIGKSKQINEVTDAIKKLEKAQFIKNSEEGYKLQTAQEKNWEKEKIGLRVTPKDRNEIKAEMLKDIFDEPKLKSYNFKGLANFKVGINVDNSFIGDDGQIPLYIRVVEDPEEFTQKTDEIKKESRENLNNIYWIFSLNSEIDDLVARLHRSRVMVAKYDQLRAQNKISPEESNSLNSEKTEVGRLNVRLRDKFLDVLGQGQAIFQGNVKDASDLGKNVAEIFKNLFDYSVPKLYTKLVMGARPLKGDEAEEVLRAVDLSSLSNIFYSDEKGLNLITKEGTKFVPNTSAEIAVEIYNYISSKYSYGEKVTGKLIDEYFKSIPYGWDRDVLRVVLATLFRAGIIDVTYKSRRYISYQDPSSRPPFTNNMAFKEAAFSPRKSLTLKELTQAAAQLEGLIGDFVNPEESYIVEQFKKLAATENDLLVDVIANAKAYNLPVVNILEKYKETMDKVKSSNIDECIAILLEQGKCIKDERSKIIKIRESTTDENLQKIKQARIACYTIGKILTSKKINSEIDSIINELDDLLKVESIFEHLQRINKLTTEIISRYDLIYKKLHNERHIDYENAINDIYNIQEFKNLPHGKQTELLTVLTLKACDNNKMDENLIYCNKCNATISEIESDIAAVQSYKSSVVTKILELTTPEKEIVKVKISEFFRKTPDSRQSIDDSIEQLRIKLHKLIDEGKIIVFE